MSSYIIEGIDRLGKSTLVKSLKTQRYFNVIHYTKPPPVEEMHLGCTVDRSYQRDCFLNMFQLLKSGANLICDRGHLGEVVYSRYRGYDGNYVFDIENQFVDSLSTQLILLIENFNGSHFKDDGLSLGSVKDRAREQDIFISAFNKSAMQRKKIICVTDPVTGDFKSKEQILDEALD